MDTKTVNAVTAWNEAQDEVARAEDGLSKAKARLQRATTKLGYRVTPSSRQPGEVYHFWSEGLLFRVKVVRSGGGGDYEIEFVEERKGGPTTVEGEE